MTSAVVYLFNFIFQLSDHYFLVIASLTKKKVTTLKQERPFFKGAIVSVMLIHSKKNLARSLLKHIFTRLIFRSEKQPLIYVTESVKTVRERLKFLLTNREVVIYFRLTKGGGSRYLKSLKKACLTFMRCSRKRIQNELPLSKSRCSCKQVVAYGGIGNGGEALLNVLSGETND